MPHLIVSPIAQRDIQRLYRFLARKNPDAARRAAKAIRNGVQILRLQPRIAEHLSDTASNVRRLLIPFGDSGYVARYRVDGNSVTILRFHHQKKQPRDLP